MDTYYFYLSSEAILTIVFLHVSGWKYMFKCICVIVLPCQYMSVCEREGVSVRMFECGRGKLMCAWVWYQWKYVSMYASTVNVYRSEFVTV